MIDLRLGDCLDVMRTLPDGCVQCCVTSPPYFGLRDYGVAGQIGLESTPDAYIARMVEVFREVRRVLRDDGTLWLNLGDSFGGPKGNNRGPGAGGGKDRGELIFGGIIGRNGGGRAKQLLGIPWRVAFALQSDGWYLRSDIIWHKPNPMPESVRDRPTKAHEYIFLLSKSATYHYDADAVKEDATYAGANPSRRDAGRMEQESDPVRFRTRPMGRTCGYPDQRNRRSVWTVATRPYKGAHFATFPPKLIEPCILAGCPVGGTVLDPFAGAGTTGVVAVHHGRSFLGIELNPVYLTLARDRIASIAPADTAA